MLIPLKILKHELSVTNSRDTRLVNAANLLLYKYRTLKPYLTILSLCAKMFDIYFNIIEKNADFSI